jgi:ligand-binding sensor domain-containing protein
VFDAAGGDLPFDGINALEIDRTGAVWVATEMGVSRYAEGSWRTWDFSQEFLLTTTFRPAKSLTIDSSGSVWVGFYRGVARYRDGAWSRMMVGDTTFPRITSHVRAMASAPDGTVYAAHDEGILRFDGTRWSAMQDAPRGYKLAIDREGAIDLLADDHLFRFDGRFWSTFTAGELGLQGRLSELAFDREGRRWYVMTSAIIHEENGQKIYTVNRDFVEPYSEMYRSIAFAPDGSLWIGGSGMNHPEYVRGSGLARVQDGAWTIYRRTTSGLPSNHVVSVRVAPDGRVWIATMDAGVAVFDPRVAASVEREITARSLHVAPSPASDRCAIRIALERGGHVRARIVDALGREHRSLELGGRDAGVHVVTIDLDGLVDGVYFIALETPGGAEHARLVIAR